MQKADRAKKLLQQYQRTFDGDGKEVLHDLCQRYYLLGDTFDPDTNMSYYKQGQRAVVLHILEMTNTNIVDLERMFAESMNRRTLEWGDE